MLGAGATKPTDSAEERAKNIFSRMDENGDGHLTGTANLIKRFTAVSFAFS